MPKLPRRARRLGRADPQRHARLHLVEAQHFRRRGGGPERADAGRVVPAFAVVIVAHALRHGGRDVEPDGVGEQRLLAARMQLFAQREHDGHQRHRLVPGAVIVEILGMSERAVRHRRVDGVRLDAAFPTTLATGLPPSSSTRLVIILPSGRVVP